MHAHFLHQAIHFVVTDYKVLFFELGVNRPIPHCRALGVDLVDPVHQHQVILTHPFGLVVEATAIEPQKSTLSHHGKMIELGKGETAFNR